MTGELDSSEPMVANIPIIDLTLLDNDGNRKSQRDLLVRTTKQACEDIGSFYVKSPLLDQVYLQSIENLIHRYFDLPLEAKMKHHISLSPLHRGYFPTGEENAKGSTIKDIKEGFDLALHLSSDDPDVKKGTPFYGQNVYPEEPADFEYLITDFFDRLRSTAEDLCKVFAEAVGLDQNYFLPMLTKPLAQLRILHYPATNAVPEDHGVGAGEHTDYGILTLLWQDQVGGLEVRDHSGRLLPVRPKIGHLFCNIGDAMQRLTNDFWIATPHRVVSNNEKSRFSAAFFFDPNYDTLLEPLSPFTNDSPPKYQPITMGAYLRHSFDGTFSYRETLDN